MIYTAEEFNSDVLLLAFKISGSCIKYNSIYGIPRGGVPLAVALSQQLRIPLLDKPIINETLVADDVVDSGRTREKWKDFDFVSIHLKLLTAPPELHPTYWIKSTEEWINYFWEKN